MKKIEYAIAAADIFIQHLHQENLDRGMIGTFGDSFRVEQGFTGREVQLRNTLSRLSRASLDGSTRLNDSIKDAVDHFWSYGDRTRPWLLTIITDGQDNGSYTYRNDPAGIGRYTATHFNHESTNFMFLIGVGEGSQIDKKSLGTMGDYGNFPAATIAAFPLLEMVFLEIAINVSSQLVGQRIDMGYMSWEQVAYIRSVSRTPIDYAFLLDRSASMSEPG